MPCGARDRNPRHIGPLSKRSLTGRDARQVGPPSDARCKCKMADIPPSRKHEKSGHPESSQGPSDICNLYSQMLYQLSYSRFGLLAPPRTFVRRLARGARQRASRQDSNLQSSVQTQHPAKEIQSTLLPYPLGHSCCVCKLAEA